jgi:hypothetical protein
MLASITRKMTLRKEKKNEYRLDQERNFLCEIEFYVLVKKLQFIKHNHTYHPT